MLFPAFSPRLTSLALALALGGCADVGSRAYYAAWNAELQQAGKLRADRNPIDAPFSETDLADAFLKIGFGSEFEVVEGMRVALSPDHEAPLTRWAVPVRYAVFGAAEAADRTAVRRFTRELQSITGLSFRPAEAEANLLVFFLDRGARAELGRIFAETEEFRPLTAFYDAWVADPEWPCAAEFYYRSPQQTAPFTIYFAVVYIRSEVEGISRASCIEEEIAQAMGLARDDPSLRPSIFNDDEEFALMTVHDAKLLRILYDPRLAPGMRAAEARPLVRRIAAELQREP